MFPVKQLNNQASSPMMEQRQSEKMVRNECLQDVQSICLQHTVSAGADCSGERKEKVSS